MKTTLSAIAAITGGLLLAGSAANFAISGTSELAWAKSQTVEEVDAAPASSYDVNTVDDYTGDPLPTLEDWVEPTAAEIAAQEAADGESIEIWVAQQKIIKKCMTEKGYPYTWHLSSTSTDPTRFDFTDYLWTLSESERNAIRAAEYGTSQGQYRWQDAGCHGLAVHLTGMDGQS